MMRILLFFMVSYLTFGCATPTAVSLRKSEGLVRRYTHVGASSPEIKHGMNNEYHVKANTIYFNAEGLLSSQIQIHEYIHWAYYQLSEHDRAELCAQWGTEFMRNR